MLYYVWSNAITDECSNDVKFETNWNSLYIRKLFALKRQRKTFYLINDKPNPPLFTRI